MAASTGKSFASRFGVHIAVLIFVAIWTVPTLGILVSSLRDKDQIIASGWWNSFASSSQTEAGRLPAASAQVEKDGKFVIEGNIFGDGAKRDISAFGVKSAAPTQYPAGTSADLGEGVSLQVNADGTFALSSPKAFEGDRGQRVYFASSAPPKFTTDNYKT
ncbi:carbohydrate ABC transporter permease, partial [Mesorhizobium sp. M4A.F.Ca.ET.029.04.2.1]